MCPVPIGHSLSFMENTVFYSKQSEDVNFLSCPLNLYALISQRQLGELYPTSSSYLNVLAWLAGEVSDWDNK